MGDRGGVAVAAMGWVRGCSRGVAARGWVRGCSKGWVSGMGEGT